MSRTGIAIICLVVVFLLLPVVAKTFRGSESSAPQDSTETPSLPSSPVASPAPSGSPSIVMIDPSNGATGIASIKKEIRVTFSVPMQAGFSVTGGGPQFPSIPKGQQPYWTPDRKTCIIPVQLQPNHAYMCGLNSKSYRNFKSESGIALDPIIYQFSTGS